ncbi:hypothetical protein DV735_g425, partial [Chaetothyriales sp. CBS 134920]
MSEFKDVESKATVLVSQSHDGEGQGGGRSDAIIIEKGLRRGLLERHISLISLASVIGASCFYGFGYALYLSGPLGFVVWALMQSIGEVTTMFPIAGGFIEHANRFVDPALGFSIAWTYYFMWSVFLGSEWNGAILILRYWISDERMPEWAWVLVFAVFFSILTTRGVVVYGEIEYYLGWFKIFSLLLCYFLSLLVNVGGFGNGYIGFKYWGHPTGYYVGTEIISLAAGETKDPIKSIPKGVKNVVWRILFVYIGLIFFQGLVCPSDSDQLVNASSKSASSPFTIAFTNAGWAWSGHFVNVLIIIAFISSANGTIYVQSRAIYSLALSGRAPKFFAITSKTGVPYIAILTSVLWGFLALMNLGTTAGKVFTYLISIGGSASYITWAGIIFTHLRVRAALDKQGIPQSSYPFKAPGTIWIYRLNLFLCIFLLLIQGFTAFERPFSVATFITSYITIPVSVVLFVGWKLWHKTHWVRLSEMDFSDRLVKPEDEEVIRDSHTMSGTPSLRPEEIALAVGQVAQLLRPANVRFSFSGGAAATLIRMQYGLTLRSTDDIDLVIQPTSTFSAESISAWLIKHYPNEFVVKTVYGVSSPALVFKKSDGRITHIEVEIFDVNAWPQRPQYNLDDPQNEVITVDLSGVQVPVFGPRWQLREKIVTAFERQGNRKSDTDLEDASNLLMVVGQNSVNLVGHEDAVRHFLLKRPEIRQRLELKVNCPEVLGSPWTWDGSAGVYWRFEGEKLRYLDQKLHQHEFEWDEKKSVYSLTVGGRSWYYDTNTGGLVPHGGV